MLNILKYFFGIALLLILLYVIWNLVSGFFSGGIKLTTTTTSTSTSATTTTQNSTSTSVVDFFKNFTLSSFVNTFRPNNYAPVYVTPANSAPNFYDTSIADNLVNGMANPNTAPNNHPTDWMPANQDSFDQQWAPQNSYYGSNNQNSLDARKSQFIQVAEPDGIMVRNNQHLGGYASQLIFQNGTFPVYILDAQGNLLGKSTAVRTGLPDINGYIPFSVLLAYNPHGLKSGYILFTNYPSNISNIHEVSTLKVFFSESYYQPSNLNKFFGQFNY